MNVKFFVIVSNCSINHASYWYFSCRFLVQNFDINDTLFVQGYTRPEFVDKSEPSQLIIKAGRHPVSYTS